MKKSLSCQLCGFKIKNINIVKYGIMIAKIIDVKKIRICDWCYGLELALRKGGEPNKVWEQWFMEKFTMAKSSVVWKYETNFKGVK